MSYIINFANISVNFNVANTLDGLINPDTSVYFIQVIADKKVYNFSGYGLPDIKNFFDLNVSNFSIITVFGDGSNIALLPIIDVEDTSIFIFGNTLYAYFMDTSTKMNYAYTSFNTIFNTLSNDKTNNRKVNLSYNNITKMILNNVDSNYNLVNTDKNTFTTTYILYQNSYNKNLAISIENDMNSIYQDSSINYAIPDDYITSSYLYINKAFYTYVINLLYGNDGLNYLKNYIENNNISSVPPTPPTQPTQPTPPMQPTQPTSPTSSISYAPHTLSPPDTSSSDTSSSDTFTPQSTNFIIIILFILILIICISFSVYFYYNSSKNKF